MKSCVFKTEKQKTTHIATSSNSTNNRECADLVRNTRRTGSYTPQGAAYSSVTDQQCSRKSTHGGFMCQLAPDEKKMGAFRTWFAFSKFAILCIFLCFFLNQIWSHIGSFALVVFFAFTEDDKNFFVAFFRSCREGWKKKLVFAFIIVPCATNRIFVSVRALLFMVATGRC